jgi:heat shock protein HslJ
MRQHLRALALAIVIAATAGGGASAAGRPEADLPPAMLDVEWLLVTMAVGGQPAEDVTGRGLTITFAADGTVSGSGGCNRFTGGYTGDASGALAITGPFGTTLMACPPPIAERETRYLASLLAVRGYVLESPVRLRLRFDQPDRQLVYTRVPAGVPNTGGGGMSWTDLRRR